MLPTKKIDCTIPTLYLSPHIRPHSDTIDVPGPPTQSQPEPGLHGSIPVQSEPVHNRSGSLSVKIMIMVCIASRAHAADVSRKWRSCHLPNSPVYWLSMSSTLILITASPLVPSRRGSDALDPILYGFFYFDFVDVCLLFCSSL